MALLSLIFDRPIRAGFETINGSERILVPFDASISESHDRSTVITENEIEDGANIADHVKLNPKTLSMEAMISESPVSLIQSGIGLAISSITQAASSALGGGLVGNLATEAVGLGLGSIANLLQQSGPFDRRDPADAMRYFDELYEKREPFTVITALKKYENMVIESLSVPRSASNGKSFRFNVTMRQLRIVSSSLVTIPAFKVGGNASAQSKGELGKQAAKEAGEKTSSNASQLMQLTQKAGFF